ncbi:carbohydrate binding domain-containing protein [bacterium]|nr:carbohydrate binding domain-containing protein [bacterium]
MLASFFGLLFSVLLTVFALAPWYVDQSLRFLMAKEIDGVMIGLTLLSIISIALLVQDIGARGNSGKGNAFMVLVLLASWIGGVCLTFWTTVEPLWQRTVPGVIFALASLWLPVIAWLPYWSLSFTNRVAIVLALMLLQPFFVLRYKIQPLNDQGQFVVMKRSDLYRQTANANQTTLPASPSPTAPANVSPLDLPVADLKTDWAFFVAREGLGKVSPAPEPNAVTIDIPPGEEINPWEIEFNRPGFSLSKDQPMEVSFRAKSTSPRTISVRFQENHEPWQSMGLDQRAELSNDWKSYRFSAIARKGDTNARLTFQVGGPSGQVTLADVRYSPAAGQLPVVASTTPPAPVAPPAPAALPKPPAAVEMPKPPAPSAPVAPVVASNSAVPLPGWKLITEQGNASSISMRSGEPDFVRVQVPDADPAKDWKVMLLRDNVTLQKGKNYLVTLRARANTARPVRIVTSQNAPPWGGMGLFQSVELSSDWKETSHEFQAIEGGPCRLYVALAGSAASMDFSSIDIAEKK